MHDEDERSESATTLPVTAESANGSGRHEIETNVARIWAEVLGVDTVGLDDNFLLLGGESLLATQVVLEIKKQLDYDISIRSVLVGTVAEVAAEIASNPSTA